MTQRFYPATAAPSVAPARPGAIYFDTTNQRYYLSYSDGDVNDWKDPLSVNERIVTANTTLTKADHGRVITVDVVGSPNEITITLPQTSTEDIEPGFTCTIWRKNGNVTIATEGGETLYSKGTSIINQYDSCVVWRHETGSPASWAATGALE